MLRRTFPQLLRIKLPGELTAWTAAGFARNRDSDDMALGVGGVDIGVGAAGSVPSWGWRDGPDVRDGSKDGPKAVWDAMDDGWCELDVDGVSTAVDNISDADYDELQQQRAALAMPHPNGATSIYSLTVTTPDLHRTIGAFERSGLELRRLSDPSPFSSSLAMAFFKLGMPGAEQVLLELVAPREPGTAVSLPGLPPLEASRDAPAAIAGMVVA
eukprot:550699-Prymnesium_polylepis.1